MVWCNDPQSKDYNKLGTFPFKFNHEKLHRKENIYDIILVLNYNMSPTKKIGEALFLSILQKKIIKKQRDVLL